MERSDNLAHVKVPAGLVLLLGSQLNIIWPISLTSVPFRAIIIAHDVKRLGHIWGMSFRT